MKCRIIFIILFLLPGRIFAQYDKYEAGVYAVANEKIIRLECDYNPISYGTGHESIILPISSTKMNKAYDGETSGVNVSGTFILVAGHDQVAYVNPFDIDLTPRSLKIIPLEVNRQEHCRQYQTEDVLKIGDIVSFINGPGGCDFEWYRVGENSFEIKMLDPRPGEYLIYIGKDKAVSFCFTIPEDIPGSEGLSRSASTLPCFDSSEPGLYTVVEEKGIPLKCTYGGSFTSDGSPANPFTFRYRDTTSSVIASNTFVFITDPTDNDTFSPVNKWMNPKALLLIPLSSDSKGQFRRYDMEVPSDTYYADYFEHVDFEWGKMEKGAYLIKIPDLAPGEYCFVVRRGKFGPFDFTKSYCFTFPSR